MCAENGTHLYHTFSYLAGREVLARANLDWDALVIFSIEGLSQLVTWTYLEVVPEMHVPC